MMIREQRRRKKRRRIGLIVFLVFVLLLALAALVVWKVFTVEKVVVDGNEHYSDSQIEQIVLNDEYSWNSLYVELKYRFFNVGDVPFVDTMEISLDDPHTVHVRVYEKGILGCFYIDAIGQYAYFDKDGFVVETSAEERPDVPKITGVACSEVILYEKLPLENEELLRCLLNLTQILKKYDLLPEEIHYNEEKESVISYGGVRVVIGTDDYLTQKVARISSILPQLLEKGASGVLHLETWTPDTTDAVFQYDT